MMWTGWTGKMKGDMGVTIATTVSPCMRLLVARRACRRTSGSADAASNAGAAAPRLVNAQWPFLNQLERRRVIRLAKVVWVRFGDSTVAEAAERRSAE